MPDLSSLIAQMTLEEKAGLCTGASAWTTQAVPRLGIPSMFVSDGPHGVRRVPDEHSLSAQSLPATCFPTGSCLASTWDSSLIFELGQALAEEAIALHSNVLLGPGVNMKRTPLCGRNFEYFAEDPFLAGELAVSLIQGIQSKGVGTSLKHFAANNQEYERFSINAVVDERTLHEIYLPAFETAVKKGKPWTVMCAYNKLNGRYGSENHSLLVETLKQAWGFEGLVVSDWGAVHDRVEALRSGLDLEMPGPKAHRVQAVVEAVHAGRLDESLLNEAVRRILNIVFKAAETPKDGTFNVEGHHALARKIAAEGMVLLKNNGILPLKGSQHFALIGRAAQTAHFQGGGSSHINPTLVDVPFVEFQKQAGESELSYCDGYPLDNSFQQELINEAVIAAKNADVALIFVALPPSKESEGYDRPDLDLTTHQIVLIKSVTAVQPNTIVILNNGSAVVMDEWIEGAAAVLEGWMMGQAGGGAVADILWGKVNPSGKLAETFPKRLVDTPAHLNFPGENGEVRYGEGLFIGYRYYDAKEIPVLFPFGYGLSYTTFSYSNLRLSAHTFRDVEGLKVSVDVTNTGKVPGKEIVQVYVHDCQSWLVRPQKELKGFAKVALEPGQTKTVTVDLDWRAFAYYHPGYHQWITEDGEFEIQVGASAADIRARHTVTLESSQELPCILHLASTIRDWMGYKPAKPIMEQFLGQLRAQLTETFAAGEGEHDGIGMDTLSFMMDMPVLSLLEFVSDKLPMPAETIVNQMLEAVRSQRKG